MLTDEMNAESSICAKMASFLEKYRRLVNNHMLFVNVEIASTSRFVVDSLFAFLCKF
jgi:hypothetical protein